MVSNKLSRINGILHRLKYLYPQNILITLYKSLFIPHINYGSLLWGHVGESIDKIQKKAIRTITYSNYLIHPPFVKRVYSECSPLIQLIALINNLKADKNDTILVMIESKSHSFCRFAFSVSRLYLNSYNPECKILDCFVCKSE